MTASWRLAAASRKDKPEEFAARPSRMRKADRFAAAAAEDDDGTPPLAAERAFQAAKGRLHALGHEVARSIMEGRSAEGVAQRAYADAIRGALIVAEALGQTAVREQTGAETPESSPEPSPRIAAMLPLVGDGSDDRLRIYKRLRGLPEAQQIALLDRYSFGRGFLMARAATDAILDRSREIVIAAAKAGTPVKDTAALIQRLDASFTPAYAETVVRTNLVNAYTAGRFRAAKDPDIADEVAGFEYMATHDSDVRPNHKAADGFFAPVGSPAWDRLSPPLGFNAIESGAMVMTERGAVPIESVQVGDSVATFQGEFAKVYGVDAKHERKRMITLTLEGGNVLSLTSDHRVLTKRGWVSAGKLRSDDEVVVTGCGACGKPVPSWREFCGAACRNRSLAARRKITREQKCEVCQKAFVTPGSRVRRFCSIACKNEAQTQHRMCAVCGKEIKQKGKKKGKLVCGVKCRGAMSRTKERPCLTCGRSIREVLMTLAKKAGKKSVFSPDRKFCTFRCWRRFNGETSIERTVREYLQANNIGFVQSAQVARYEVDFVLPAFFVAIECDGTYWHGSERVKARDAKKDALLQSKGYAVIRFTEESLKKSDGEWQGRLYALCKDRINQLGGALGKVA